MESYAQIDFLNIPVKRLCFEEITGSLPAASANTSRVVRFNGKPYWSDGTNWIDLSATGAGGSSVQLPQNTKFVSPNFTNISPFYNDISIAISNSSNGDYIIVFPGAYSGNFDLSKRHWYFHSKTSISGNTVVCYDADTSIRGECIFDGNTSGAAIDVYYNNAPNIEFHILEYDTSYQGMVNLNSWCGIIKCNQIGDTFNILGSAPDATYQAEICIDAKKIQDININSLGSKVYINCDIVAGKITMEAGDAEIEFKRFTNLSTSSLVTVAGKGTGNKIAKLKLIDGSFPESHDGDAPVTIGDYAQVILQHIWIKNAHSSAVYLAGSVRNSHLLKVDNCILIANPAIDATLTAQNCHCFGSWGQSNVSTSIAMVTEPISVGVIW